MATPQSSRIAGDLDADLPPRLPTTLGDYLRSIGPGLVLAMAFLGTGDLVSSTVSGANYGYALMWTLVVALAARYCMISAIAKYKLANRFEDSSLMAGYQRLWKGFPAFFAILMLVYGLIIQMSFMRACAVALVHLIESTGLTLPDGFGLPLMGLIVMLLSLVMLAGRNAFKWLERLARGASVIIIGSCVYALFRSGHIDFPALLSGLTFAVPADNGPFDALFIAVATIGTIGGSAINLLYPYFMDDRGWNRPAHRKIQRLDLIAGMLPLLIINALFWIVAAETLRGTGVTVSSETDLATMMQMAVGDWGPTLLWVSLFMAAFTSFPAQAHGLAKLMFNGLHLATGKRDGEMRPEQDPRYRPALIGLFIVAPLFITLPFAPNLVYLSVFGTSVITATVLPPILIGILILTTSRRFMLDDYANRWWETLILGVISLIGLWSLYAILTNLAGAIARVAQ